MKMVRVTDMPLRGHLPNTRQKRYRLNLTAYTLEYGVDRLSRNVLKKPRTYIV
jgi:hypothetical protein